MGRIVTFSKLSSLLSLIMQPFGRLKGRRIDRMKLCINILLIIKLRLHDYSTAIESFRVHQVYKKPSVMFGTAQVCLKQAVSLSLLHKTSECQLTLFPSFPFYKETFCILIKMKNKGHLTLFLRAEVQSQC